MIARGGSHDSDSIVVENCRNVFRGKLVRCVTYKETCLADSTVSDDDTPRRPSQFCQLCASAESGTYFIVATTMLGEACCGVADVSRSFSGEQWERETAGAYRDNGGSWEFFWRLRTGAAGSPNEWCCEWEGLVPNSQSGVHAAQQRVASAGSGILPVSLPGPRKARAT